MYCNRKAVFNLKHVDGKADVSGPAVQLGCEEKYYPTCYACYHNALIEAGEEMPSMVLCSSQKRFSFINIMIMSCFYLQAKESAKMSRTSSFWMRLLSLLHQWKEKIAVPVMTSCKKEAVPVGWNHLLLRISNLLWIRQLFWLFFSAACGLQIGTKMYTSKNAGIKVIYLLLL